MSAATPMEEVKSVVLEINNLESQKQPYPIELFVISANQTSVENSKTQCFTF